VTAETPRFDHLLHCVGHVGTAVDDYTAAGLLAAHTNEPFDGFQNGAWRPDERYIEILTIVDRAEFTASAFGKAMAGWMERVDALIAGGGGALNFAVNVADATATAERLREQGHDVRLETFTFFPDIAFREAILSDVPLWAPFFITYDIDADLLRQVGEQAKDERGEYDLAGFVIETPDPAGAADWLGTLVGVPADGTVVPLPGGHVHFTEGPADAITTLLLTGPNPPEKTLHGLRLAPA